MDIEAWGFRADLVRRDGVEGVREGGKAILILMTEGRKERGTNSNTEDTLSRSYYLKIVERTPTRAAHSFRVLSLSLYATTNRTTN